MSQCIKLLLRVFIVSFHVGYWGCSYTIEILLLQNSCFVANNMNVSHVKDLVKTGMVLNRVLFFGPWQCYATAIRAFPIPCWTWNYSCWGISWLNNPEIEMSLSRETWPRQHTSYSLSMKHNRHRDRKEILNLAQIKQAHFSIISQVQMYLKQHLLAKVLYQT